MKIICSRRPHKCYVASYQLGNSQLTLWWTFDRSDAVKLEDHEAAALLIQEQDMQSAKQGNYFHTWAEDP